MPEASAAKPDAQFQALVREKYAGNPAAMAALGAQLVVGRDAPLAPVDGAALIAEAAEQGDPSAWAHLSVLAAAGVGRAQSWSDAYAALERAHALGDPGAAPQLALLSEIGVRTAADAEQWITAAARETLRETPRFLTCAGFLPAAACAYLIERARPKLVQARVFDANRGVLKVDAMRTNTGAIFSLIETDLVTQLVRARIAHAAGVPANALEPAEVLHYSIGESYRPHVDFFHPQLPNFAEQMRVKGQRIKTCLVYLNDDFEGGETEFPKLKIKYRGAAGDALIFENVKANGAGDLQTLHAGLAPTRGEKWLFSQWIRSKAQPIA
jgi:predicted 2-oxoglutarate/Fe(II)-dependent dioxygenase YbiX